MPKEYIHKEDEWPEDLEKIMGSDYNKKRFENPKHSESKITEKFDHFCEKYKLA